MTRLRPDLDRSTVRHFVYFLLDGDGVPVYIGRSCNVRARIQTHARNSTQPVNPEQNAAEWFHEVRDVTMVGPFAWDDVVRREREEIERHQPRGNRSLTARDHRPFVAGRSARRAS